MGMNMKTKFIKMISVLLIIALSIGIILLSGCADNTKNHNSETSDTAIKQNEVVISFDYEKQSGYASNQFAVWIEDMDGKLIKTLYATRFTASGGYKDRPEAIPVWVEKYDLASRSDEQVDAVTSSTPKEGRLSYFWDLTDESGTPVQSGSEYKFCVEGSLRWNNHVLYSGTIKIGGSPAAVYPEAAFSFEASDDQPALTESSKECKMIGTVTAEYVPAAKS